MLIVWALWHVREVESYALSKFQPPTTLGHPQTVEKTTREKLDFLDLGFGNRFFIIFAGFWRSWTILNVEINFLVKCCSRYTYSEVRATKNWEKTICAAKTWPPRATGVLYAGGWAIPLLILNGKEQDLRALTH